ncbi:hypothetical protein CCHR01_05319 [Colletotrichum chrysophilum]|uniref:Uncharacterized protein n=1 Tax=Colletotrichum chrysophilum TaxID=1836956 RepID=A0AAD9AUQ3_9PEZI|nr:hypothetical protein CCHR01_05319 [Colletotrichum chrysophilum]
MKDEETDDDRSRNPGDKSDCSAMAIDTGPGQKRWDTTMRSGESRGNFLGCRACLMMRRARDSEGVAQSKHEQRTTATVQFIVQPSSQPMPALTASSCVLVRLMLSVF